MWSNVVVAVLGLCKTRRAARRERARLPLCRIRSPGACGRGEVAAMTLNPTSESTTRRLLGVSLGDDA